MNTELENYKKSIVKEQEHNEQLTLLLRKIETDINHIKRLIDQCEVKSEALKVDYMTYTRALQETEQALTIVTGVSKEYYYHNYVICMYYHIWQCLTYKRNKTNPIIRPHYYINKKSSVNTHLYKLHM